ncbi:MAG: hypothetical protein AB1815_09000 [Bacillota bacterium]
MSLKKILSKLKIYKKPQVDITSVKLPGLNIILARVTSPEIPHEVTVIVPRAEIREKYDQNEKITEREIVLSSITVVHAPRHPLAGPPVPPMAND